MSMWDRVQRLPERLHQQTQTIYGDHFPIEVRSALADWIEKHQWREIDPDNPEIATFVAQAFLQELESRATKTDDFVTRLKLIEALNSFKQQYNFKPAYLVHVIRNCLDNERKIIEQYENSLVIGELRNPCTPDPFIVINQQIADLRRGTNEMDEELRRMNNIEESFVIQYQELQKRRAYIQQLQQTQGTTTDVLAKATADVGNYEKLIRDRISEVIKCRMDFSDRIHNTIENLNSVQTTVLSDQVTKWKRDQQLAGNGAPVDSNLDQIQEWCEYLAELCCQNLQLINRVQLMINNLPTNSVDQFKERFTRLGSRTRELLTNLVLGTFIIEKQPPQVMKTNTRFQATVRLLVAGKLNIHMAPPQVRVSIISEALANQMQQSDSYCITEASGEILNNVGAMEYHQATRQLSVSFRNMQLKKIKRAEKKGTESVMDEKFCLLFQSSFQVVDMPFTVWTLSLPVVVIVHGNQEPHAWATITWDNSFSEMNRVLFAVPDKVAWGKMAEVLSMKFRASTGCGLNEQHLIYLATKAFRTTQLPTDYHNMMLSWTQFCKEPLPEYNFTFWEWFYAIMKVTREHLRPLWNSEVIFGFVSRHDAQEMLKKTRHGTFLLRFSDSELGGLTIAYVEEQADNQNEVLMVSPFTSRDFVIRSLADRISDLQQLLYLYPDKPKNSAFEKFYTQTDTSQRSNGYIKPLIVQMIPRASNGLLDSISNPSTPQSFYQAANSPDNSVLAHFDPQASTSMGIDPTMQWEDDKMKIWCGN